MRKWILSIMFAICMVIIFMPQAAFAANADHTELQNLLNGGDTVKLEADYTIDSTLEVTSPKGVTLDLNGHVIRREGSGSVIRVDNGASLTLQDSSPAAAHDGLPCGGVLTGGIFVDTGSGGGVNVASGSFTMNGGTIYGCTAKYGGGVNVAQGSFTMNGGNIYCCTADSGGGVYINNNNVFNYDFKMTGGVIDNCAASSSGDAVSTNAMATFLADGGTIIGTVALGGEAKIESGNSSCTRFYGAVENVATYASVTISGGIYYGGIPSRVNTEGNYKTVSFDLNGGEGYIPDQWFFNDITAMILSPANPTKEGYQSFDGWWYNGYTGYTKYNFTQPVTGNITLTAKFSNPKKYNISYTLNGGTATNPTSYTVESDTIKLNNPEKPGYTFTGWSGTDLNGADNMTVTIPKGSTGARNYTANWTPKSYVVTLDTNGGKINSGNVTDYTYGTGASLPTATDITRTDYTFKGWYADENFSGSPVTEISKTDTGNKVFYAKWEAITAVPVTITGTDSVIEYTGTDIDVSQYFTIDSHAGAATYSLLTGTEGGTGEGTLSGTNLSVDRTGNFKIKVNTAANDIYAAGEETITLTVNKKSVSITAQDQNIVWGNSIDKTKYNVDGLVTGHSIKEITLTPSTAALTENGTIAISGVKIENAAGKDVTGNYNITTFDGTLKIGHDTALAPESIDAVKTKTSYIAGDTLNVDDITVTAHYADGYSEAVTGFTTNAADIDMSKAGKKTMTVSYSQNGETRTADITIKVDAASGGGGGGGGGGYIPPVQNLTIDAGEGIKVTLSAYGTVATITVDDGYELADVVLNGVSKGKVTEVKGLKTGDKLVVTAAKKETEPTDPAKAEILAKLSEQKLAARSALVTMKNGKKAVRITWYNRNGEMMDFDGVEIYRSTKKNSGYGKKPIFTSKTDKYTNTSVKVGTRYYYKVRGFVIIDGQKYYTDWSLKAIRTVK